MSIDYAKLGFRPLQDEEEKKKEINYEALGMRPISEEDDYSRFKGTTAKGALKAVGRGAISGLTTVNNIGQMLAQVPGQFLLGLGELNLPDEAKKIPMPTKERVSEYLSQQEGDDILPQVMLPSGHEIASFATGTPEDYKAPFGERLLEGGTEALISAPIFGMSPAQAILPFGGSFVAKELGGETLTQLAAGLGAGGVHVAGSIGKDLLKNAYSSVKEKGVVGALAELGAKFSKVKPEAEALFAATDGNAPFSTLADSKVAQFAESILAKNPNTAETYVKQAEDLVKVFKERVNDSLFNAKIDPKATAQQASEILDTAIKTGITDTEGQLKRLEDQLIRNSSKATLVPNTSFDVAEKNAAILGKDAKPFLPTQGKTGKEAFKIFNPIRGMVNQNALQDFPLATRISEAVATAESNTKAEVSKAWKALESVVPKTAVVEDSISNSLKQSVKEFVDSVNANKENLTPHNKNAVISFADNVANLVGEKVPTGLFDANGNPVMKKIPVTVRSLIGARKMANSIYGGKEGYEELALVVKDKLDDALKMWSKTNKTAFDLHTEAVRQSRDYFKKFPWDVKKIAHPETLKKEGQLGFFRKESGIKALKKALPKEAFDALHTDISDSILNQKFGKKAINQYLAGKNTEEAAQAMIHDLQKYEGIIRPEKMTELRTAIANIEGSTSSTPGVLGKGKGQISIGGDQVIDTLFKLEQKLASGKLTPIERKAYEDLTSAIYQDLDSSAGGLKTFITKINASKDTLSRLKNVYEVKGGIQNYIKDKLKTPKGIETLKQELKDLPGSDTLIKQGQSSLLAEELEKNIFSKDSIGKRELNYIQELVNNPEMENILGKDGIKALEELHKNNIKILESAAFFANPSQTSVQQTGKLYYMGLGSGFFHLLTTGNPLFLAKVWGLGKLAEQSAKLLTNPEFKKAFLLGTKNIASAPTGSMIAQKEFINIGKKMSLIAGLQAAKQQNRDSKK